MILYVDTSSLVKLYIEERHSAAVRKWVGEAVAVATSRVAYPEAVAAISRRWREGDLTEKGFTRVRHSLSQQWPQFAAVEMNEHMAGELAVKHALRGLDAIHLEAALALRSDSGDIIVAFSSFDHRLNQAALAEGFRVLDDTTVNTPHGE